MSDIIKGQFSFAIAQGEVPLEDMLRRIDAYHIEGKLTDEERATLYAEAREAAVANFGSSLDVPQTLIGLDHRISTLEHAVDEINDAIIELFERTEADENDPGDEPDEPVVTPAPDFIDGRWYYNGDRVTFEGKEYTCNAPDGFPVVWSPSVTPQYWDGDDD